MPPESDHDKTVAKDLLQRVEHERERQKLMDKSVGGPDMPRPDDAYIRQHMGDAQTPAQMKEAAHKKAWEKNLSNERAKELLPELEQKMEGRRETPEEPRKGSIFDQLKAMPKTNPEKADNQIGIGNNIGRNNDKDGPGIER